MSAEVDAVLQTFQGEAHTLVRCPDSTVSPPQDGLIGRRAFEVLQGLLFDPRALIDEGPLGQGPALAAKAKGRQRAQRPPSA